MLVMMAICLLTFPPFTSPALHSLQYFYTSTSGISGFPEFIAVGYVDDIEIMYYDSTSKKVFPKQDWMKTDALDPAYWWGESQVAMEYEQAFKANMNILKDRFNQTGGVHTLQKTYGCQWDDENGVAGRFEQFGFDREDFMFLDLHNMKWVAVLQKAIPTTQIWNRDEMAFQYRRDYFHNICVAWLKKYVHYGSHTLQRTVCPEVSLLQRGPNVACLATGFYPEEVMITWKKDGVEVEDDVDEGETLPNGDGTFQKRAVLTVSPEERKKAQYSCEVTHRSGKPIDLICHEEEIISTDIAFVVGVVAGILFPTLITGGVIAVVLMKKKDYNKFPQVDTTISDTEE